MSGQRKAIIRLIISTLLFATVFALSLLIDLPFYLKLSTFVAVYLFAGWEIGYKAIRGLFRGMVTDENLLMFVATVGAFAVGEYPEAVAVLLFYNLGEIFQAYAVNKSRKSITELMDLAPEKATVIRDGQRVTVSPDEVNLGEEIVVLAGEKIPLDGMVTAGRSTLDTSMLTGESKPIDIEEGAKVLSGSINLNGVITIKTDCEYSDSTVSRILDLVENATGKKAKTERFISRFASVYTPIVMCCALVLGIVPPLFMGGWKDWLYRALTFLVVSCPCALLVSIPLAFFGAIGSISKRGVLIKGGVAIETLSKIDTILLDKTGTLTKGNFAIKRVLPQESREEILSVASIVESKSTHPIARAITSEIGEINANDWQITECAGRGIKAENGANIALVGNLQFMQESNINASALESPYTVLYVAKNGKYLGAIELGDEIKEDSKDAIGKLRQDGIKTVMLTGDNESVAKQVANSLEIDEFKSGLLPDGKVTEAQKYLARKGKTAFVGDGINDAPLLAQADLGVAMGAIGSDSAIETADIVLMNDNLTSFVKARKHAKKTMRIVIENLIFSLGIKFAVLLLSSLGLAGMWLAILADVGVMCLAVINSMRSMVVSKKN